MTKTGQNLISHPGRLLSELVPSYLLRLDHGAHLRFDGQLLGNWDIFLNLINVETEQGCSLEHLRTVLYGAPETDQNRFDEVASTIYITVVRPLCWAGLLQSDQPSGMASNTQFFKTELWRRYLRLDTDRHLDQLSVH